MSNYPDDIRAYDDCPQSPFYPDDVEDSDRYQEILEGIIEEENKDPSIGAIDEALGPDAWANPIKTRREIVDAIVSGDPLALINAIEESFWKYMSDVHHDRILDQIGAESDI